MPNLSPEQIRDQAARLEGPARELLQHDEDAIRTAETMLQSVRALRAAADQLEAVRIWNQTDERSEVLDRDWLDAILDGDLKAITAISDTAFQEDRDE